LQDQTSCRELGKRYAKEMIRLLQDSNK